MASNNTSDEILDSSEHTIQNTDIKLEIDSCEHEINEIQIKLETEESDEPMYPTDNPFQNVQVEVKEEIILSLERENNDSQSDDVELSTVQSITARELGNSILPKAENIKADVKQEGDSLVSYDYPNFDDSMDSNEAAALSHVEACLQDEINIKSENDDFEDNQKQEYDKVIKEESEFTVTETHLISNKLINTTSTVTNPRDGIIESQTTKTLVMEILPIPRGNVALSKIGNPEEILPTSRNTNDDYNIVYDDSFQLNSITGNVLSLEQEAYGLLQAKKKMDLGDKSHVCPKCPKAYKNKRDLKRHLGVHETIDKRALGVIKGQKTRTINRNKKLKEEQNIKIKIIKKETGVGKVKKTRSTKRGQRSLENDCEIKLKQEDDIKKEMGDVKVKKTRTMNRKKKLKEEECSLKIKKEEKVIKKEGYECTCGKVFQRRSRMETCLRSHNLFSDMLSFPCTTCLKNFRNKEELLLHRKRLHRKRFPCKFCPTDYNSRKELFKHLQAHQKVQLMEYKVISEVVKGKQKLKCFICSKTCTELSDLKCHVMDDHKEPYSCPRCKRTFSKIIDFGNHTKTFHPEVEGQSVLDVLEAFSKLVQAWKCEECGLQFHEADKLAMHQIEKHSPDVKAESQFQCTDCRRVFITQKGLTSHRRIHHSTESVEETVPVDVGVMCLECRKMCKDMTALTSHMRLHSPERKYPCKFCDFRFATQEKRKAHAEVHTGDMKYVCFICEYQCSSENRLKHHKMSLKHLNMKEFLLTGKPLVEEQSTSKIKDTLRKKEWGVKRRKKEKKLKDRDKSDSEEVEEVACDICGDKFPSEIEMSEHKVIHPFIQFPNDDGKIFFK